MIARRLLLTGLVSLCVLVGVVVLGAASAVAAAPETPEGLAPAPLMASAATLHGVLNPGKEGAPGTFELDTYEFVYRESKTECEGAGEVVTEAGLSLGGGKEEVSRGIEGLTAGAEYTACLVVHNEADTETAISAPVTFTTLAAAPKIEEASITDVASSSATLNAQVNPGGAAITYTFEYAPAGAGFTPVQEPEGAGSIPAGIEGVPLTVHVQHGLTPNTNYQFRLTATNTIETVTGTPVSFTTQRTGGSGTLPDDRQYEMVTPPEKLGALFFGYQRGQETFIQASSSGDAIVDQASQPSELEPAGYANEEQVLSTRGATGWSSQALDVPQSTSVGPNIGNPEDYRFFSEDLSLGVVRPYGSKFLALSPEASEWTPYLRTDYLNGNVSEHCEASYLSASSCFQPLVTGCPATGACPQAIEEHANVPRGTEFGQPSPGHGVHDFCADTEACGPQFVDGTPDLSHIILRSGESSVPLTSPTMGPFYEWVDGQLRPLPAELAVGPSSEAPEVGEQHLISVDGTRVVLQSSTEPNATLYLGDTNLPSSGDPNAQSTLEIAVGKFDTASADDSRIFFTSGDLFAYDLNAEAGHRVTDLTNDVGVSQVFGASEDGSYVYFSSPGVLTPDATPSECENPDGAARQETETCNLYVYHDGVTTLIARSGTMEHEARVSPNGHWLAFMSSKDLTGYDTRDAVDGHLDQEVYLYNADTHRLVCASCDPTGARPVGVVGETLAGKLAGAGIGTPSKLEEGGVASSIPAWHRLPPIQYQARYLSDSGRLFFNSESALVPQDVNNAQDVYEYEPAGILGTEGEPQCTSASVTFSERSGGCVSLISSGISAQPSAFLDASEDGSDVFFITNSRLAVQDPDSAPDVYDAHECTVASPCTPAAVAEPPPCTTEASCKPSPAPQPAIFGPSASATFSGQGNIAPAPTPLKVTNKAVKCKKGFVKNEKGKCIKKHRKKARRAKRASNDRRGK